ncbi:type II toxin-antitoxin system RelE/ParE family toxin [Novosphingobium sp. HII-3]|uniref:type II toxin-antitoxin system RelE family toxin n=1 Tax=Novosphingobium sp. HII-3 TaxID=2075565 RepID=UPI000CDA86E7|nr:type II toxin-antitoxin system RelE/ParE family toxin [Novosphingobium sp. HII-3]
MAWQIELTDTAERALSKLDRTAAKRIITFLRTRIADAEDPRSSGKALTGQFAGLWRYRVGDYRLICEIQDGKLLILVVTVGHRRDIYR